MFLIQFLQFLFVFLYKHITWTNILIVVPEYIELLKMFSIFDAPVF